MHHACYSEVPILPSRVIHHSRNPCRPERDIARFAGNDDESVAVGAFGEVDRIPTRELGVFYELYFERLTKREAPRAEHHLQQLDSPLRRLRQRLKSEPSGRPAGPTPLTTLVRVDLDVLAESQRIEALPEADSPGVLSRRRDRNRRRPRRDRSAWRRWFCALISKQRLISRPSDGLIPYVRSMLRALVSPGFLSYRSNWNVGGGLRGAHAVTGSRDTLRIQPK